MVRIASRAIEGTFYFQNPTVGFPNLESELAVLSNQS